MPRYLAILSLVLADFSGQYYVYQPQSGGPAQLFGSWQALVNAHR